MCQYARVNGLCVATFDSGVVTADISSCKFPTTIIQQQVQHVYICLLLHLVETFSCKVTQAIYNLTSCQTSQSNLIAKSTNLSSFANGDAIVGR